MANRSRLLQARVEQLDAAGARSLMRVDAVPNPLAKLNCGGPFSLGSTTTKKGSSQTTTSTEGSSLRPFHSFQTFPGIVEADLGQFVLQESVFCFFLFIWRGALAFSSALSLTLSKRGRRSTKRRGGLRSGSCQTSWKGSSASETSQSTTFPRLRWWSIAPYVES